MCWHSLRNLWIVEKRANRPMLFLCYIYVMQVLVTVVCWPDSSTSQISLFRCVNHRSTQSYTLMNIQCRMSLLYIHTLLFPPKGAFRNNHYLQALHLTNYNTKLSVNYKASLIANYNIFKLNKETFTKLSKSWFLWRRFKTWTDWLNLREGSTLFQSLIVP